MTHSMPHSLALHGWLAGLLALCASLAVIAAEPLSDLDLSQMYGSSFRSQILESQDEWRENASDANWRADDEGPTQGRIEFSAEQIREHERIQQMLDQQAHSFDPKTGPILLHRF